MIGDAEKEFNQCKKYNYFGNSNEAETRDLIEKIKKESVKEFDAEDDVGNDLEESTSNTYDNPGENDSGKTGDQEKDDSLINNQDSDEKKDVEDSVTNEDKQNNTEIDDETGTDGCQETSSEQETEDGQNTDDDSVIGDTKGEHD